MCNRYRMMFQIYEIYLNEIMLLYYKLFLASYILHKFSRGSFLEFGIKGWEDSRLIPTHGYFSITMKLVWEYFPWKFMGENLRNFIRVFMVWLGWFVARTEDRSWGWPHYVHILNKWGPGIVNLTEILRGMSRRRKKACFIILTFHHLFTLLYFLLIRRTS